MMKVQCLFILLLTFNFLSAQEKDPQAGTRWSQYDFTSHFTIQDNGAGKILTENKRIFISTFQITQISVASGNQYSGTKNTNMTVSLTPIDLIAYQKVVDKLYKKVIDQLQAEGYTIVPDEEVAKSEFAKKQHTDKSIICAFAKGPVSGKDKQKNEVISIFPTHKFIAATNKNDQEQWITKLGKAIDATIISIVLNINPVSFESEHKEGSREGVSMEAHANLVVTPSCLVVNAQGGFSISATPIDGKSNWVGPKGLSETNKEATVFGSVQGNYVLDVNQREYLYQVETMAGGAMKGFLTALKEAKQFQSHSER